MSFPAHNPVLIVALVMLVVLLAPLIFARVRIPGLVGLIIAGVAIGPHALGLLERDLTMEVLGTLGLLYIMFLAGLEVNLHEFSKYRGRSLLFGALTFLFPQLLGTLMAHTLLGFNPLQAILLGSVFASHTLVAYPIASRLGLSKQELVTTAVGATIITDTSALLVLAVIARTTGGDTGVDFWLFFLLFLLAYTVLVLWGLPRLGRWFFRTVRAGDIADFVFVLAAVFTVSFLAEMAGVEAIIGAFLAGLALNRLVPEQSLLMSRLRFVGEALFIPFFLISVGMLVDLGVLFGGRQTLFVAGAMTATVLVTKWAAAATARPMFGYRMDQVWMLFGLTIPQAAATLAAVVIGFDLGFFGEDVLNGTIVMIMVTCMLGPWVVDRYGRRLAMQLDERPYSPDEAPQRILIPLSNPATSDALVDLALAIRRPGSEEALFPLAVVREGEDVAAGERLLSSVVLRAVAAEAPVIPMTRVDMRVSIGIERAIADRRISHVVIGWGGLPSPTQRIFGSILDRLLDLSSEMILVCRLERPINTVQRILLAVPPLADRESGFEEVVRTVKMLAERLEVSLAVLVQGAHAESIEELVRAARPEVPMQTIRLTTFLDLLPVLAHEVTGDDLVVLLSARERQLSWQPALNRLPRLFAQRLPNADFVVMYPAEQAAASLPTGRPPELPPAHIVPALPAGSATSALHMLLHQPFQDHPDVLRRLVALLARETETPQLEISPGVMLLHAHTELVSRSMLLAAASPAGITFPHLAHPVHVLFVLLNPPHVPPEMHLRTLAHVARVVMAAQDGGKDIDLNALLAAMGMRPD